MSDDSRSVEIRNPMQPIVADDGGIVRFKANEVVQHLLAEASAGRKCDLNSLAYAAAEKGFSQADMEQFAQLIGYSIVGFHELSYVSDGTARAASRAVVRAFGHAVERGCRAAKLGCPIHSGVKRAP